MKFYLLLLPLLAFGSVSCKTFNNSQTPPASSYEVSNLREQVQSTQSGLTNVIQALKSLQEQNQMLALRIQEIQTRLDQVGQQLSVSPQTATELAQLRSALQALDERRVNDSKALADAMSRQLDQTNQAVRQLATTPRASSSAQSTDIAAGEYYKHTVKAGQTLGAIAQAYKVTVGEIQSANKLKSANIYVGQILLVPKKN